MKVTVVYARPEHQWLAEPEIAEGATVRNAVEASGLMELAGKFEPDGIFGVGVNGRAAGWDDAVSDGDRVDICRALRQSPRERRRRAAREEAAR